MAQPTITDGTDTITLNINTNITETEKPNIVQFKIPNRSGIIMQDMGRGSLSIPIKGYTVTQADKNTLKGWARARTKLTYNDDENTSVFVRMINFSNTRIAGRPSYYEYSFTIVQVE